jgi:integrase
MAEPPNVESGRPKLLDQVRAAIRLRHYSRRTEESYVGWIRRYIVFHGKRHPSEMGAAEVAGFLTHLAERARVSASTQNQALCAILFLHRHVLERTLEPLAGVTWAKKMSHVPVVLSPEEVARVLDHLRGVMWLIAVLLYDAELRLTECLDLRVKDLDFDRRQITVRSGKGGKDRPVPLPTMAVEALVRQLDDVLRLHQRYLAAGYGRVVLPDALARRQAHAEQDQRRQTEPPHDRGDRIDDAQLPGDGVPGRAPDQGADGHADQAQRHRRQGRERAGHGRGRSKRQVALVERRRCVWQAGASC